VSRAARTSPLLALLAALCGCAGAQTQAATPTPPARGPLLSAQLILHGAAELTTSYTERRAGYRSCADVALQRPAAGDAPGDFALPVPADNGQRLTVAVVITPYHGPRHYTTADIGDDDTLIALADKQAAYQFGATTRADGDVRADGSGTMSLTDLENPAQQKLSVTLTWTCAEQ
jgi:hypothetical protein